MPCTSRRPSAARTRAAKRPVPVPRPSVCRAEATQCLALKSLRGWVSLSSAVVSTCTVKPVTNDHPLGPQKAVLRVAGGR